MDFLKTIIQKLSLFILVEIKYYFLLILVTNGAAGQCLALGIEFLPSSPVNVCFGVGGRAEESLRGNIALINRKFPG